jgi:hypothetical protein
MRSPGRPVLVLGASVLLASCLKQYVQASPGGVLDSLCDPNAVSASSDWLGWQMEQVQFRTPRGWGVRVRQPFSLTLGRVDSELNVWSGSEWRFPAVEPRQSVQCELTRQDTIIVIRGVRLNGLANYRVDVSWKPPIEGRWQYMQLQTRYAEHVRAMRGIIESARFVPPVVPSGSVTRP